MKKIRTNPAKLPEANATVTWHENGLPRQRQFSAPTEEKLIADIFWFHVENWPVCQLDKIHYQGNSIEWKKISSHAHLFFGKSRMSFEEFKEACLNEPQKQTA